MHSIGRQIAAFLNRPIKGYEPATPPDFVALQRCLVAGDVVLIEGGRRISTIVKYITQSTWSHAALYVGDVIGTKDASGEPHVLVEAELEEGVIGSPLSKYRDAHVRVCRPIGITEEDRHTVVRYVINRIGCQYDLKNVTDLARYLFPLPLPARFRRRMLAMGSRSPTRAICSSLVAQAFQHVRYPILPRVKHPNDDRWVKSQFARDEILRIRHYSLYSPRDFDLSPYFSIVKPTIEKGFDYKSFQWGEDRPTLLHLSLDAAVAARSFLDGRDRPHLEVSARELPIHHDRDPAARTGLHEHIRVDEDRWIQEIETKGKTSTER
jgi:hypothetical protein